MRILHIHSGLRGIGSYCRNMHNGQIKKGHKVLVVSEAKWQKEPINVCQSKSILLGGLMPCTLNPLHMMHEIKKFNPDIIHYHWPSGSFDIYFPLLLTLRKPIVVTVHVAVASKKAIADKIWYNYYRMFKPYLRKVQGVNCISNFIAQQVIKRSKSIKPKIKIIYAGMDETKFYPSKRKLSNNINALFVGQIMPEKGIDILVKVIQKHKDINLRIVGDGHLKHMLEKKTAKSKNITWVGFVKEQEKIRQEYNNADILMLPTRWDEAFSLVPIEAMACGTPVLASNKGGNPEIVKHGKNGYLLNYVSEEALDAIVSMLDKKKLENMRKATLEHIQKHFTFSKMINEHDKWYKQVITSYKKKKHKN